MTSKKASTITINMTRTDDTGTFRFQNGTDFDRFIHESRTSALHEVENIDVAIQSKQAQVAALLDELNRDIVQLSDARAQRMEVIEKADILLGKPTKTAQITERSKESE